MVYFNFIVFTLSFSNSDVLSRTDFAFVITNGSMPIDFRNKLSPLTFHSNEHFKYAKSFKPVGANGFFKNFIMSRLTFINLIICFRIEIKHKFAQ